MSKRIAHISLELTPIKDSVSFFIYLEIQWFPSRDLLGIGFISDMEEKGQLNQVNEGEIFTIRSSKGETLSGYTGSNGFRLELSSSNGLIAVKTVTKSVFDAILNIVREFDGKPIDREIDVPIYSDKVKGGKHKTQRRNRKKTF